MFVLTSVRLDADALSLADGKTSSWIQVAKPIKAAKKGQRVFDITDEHIDQMVANAATSNEIPIDYNHLSLEPVLPEQAIAAGWFKGFKKEDGNLYGQAEWTDKAADHIRKGEFRYISPTINFSANNEHGDPVGARLISAALTIYPFLQGMQPVALSTLYASGVVLADLSIDEKRSRLSAAITNKYPLDFTWIADVFDNYLVFERGGKKFRQDYSIDDKLQPTFSGEPKEVIPQWEVVPATTKPSGVNMSANNQNTENPDFVTMRSELATLSATVTSLSERTTKAEADAKTQKDRADSLQLQLTTTEANTAVDTLVRDRKIKVDDKATWVEMYLGNKDMYVKLTATLQAAPIALNTEHGSNEDDTRLMNREQPTAIVEMTAAIDKYITDNGGKEKVRYGDALRAVTVANPKLADRYRMAFAEPEVVVQ